MSDIAIGLNENAVQRTAPDTRAAPRISEDVLSLILGLVIFALALPSIGGVDLLGWAVSTSVWTDLSKALAPLSKSYSSIGGVGALAATYVLLLRKHRISIKKSERFFCHVV